MSHSLRCHPSSPCAAVTGIEVGVARLGNGDLRIAYRLRGRPSALAIPAPQPPAQGEDLWRHTCCEAFIAPVDGEDYAEFNFSPSGQWAAYRFSGYRRRDPAYCPDAAPAIEFLADDDGFRLDARLPAALLPAARRVVLGLTAVVECRDGAKSYWALAHAGARPDFHLRQSFTLAIDLTTP